MPRGDDFLGNVETNPARQLLGGDAFPVGPSRDDVMARGRLSLYELGAIGSPVYGCKIASTIGAAYGGPVLTVPPGDCIRVESVAVVLTSSLFADQPTTFLGVGVIPVQRPLTATAGLIAPMSPLRRDAGWVISQGEDGGAISTASASGIVRVVLSPGDQILGKANGIAAGDICHLMVIYQRLPASCRPPV